VSTISMFRVFPHWLVLPPAAANTVPHTVPSTRQPELAAAANALGRCTKPLLALTGCSSDKGPDKVLDFIN